MLRFNGINENLELLMQLLRILSITSARMKNIRKIEKETEKNSRIEGLSLELEFFPVIHKRQDCDASHRGDADDHAGAMRVETGGRRN